MNKFAMYTKFAARVTGAMVTTIGVSTFEASKSFAHTYERVQRERVRAFIANELLRDDTPLQFHPMSNGVEG